MLMETFRKETGERVTVRIPVLSVNAEGPNMEALLKIMIVNRNHVVT